MPDYSSANALSSIFRRLRGGEFEIALVRAIVEASPDGILVVDAENHIVAHNQRFFQVWRIREEQVPGARGGSAEGVQDHHVLHQAVARVEDPDSFLARVRELYAAPELDDHSEVGLKDGRTLERHSTSLWGKGEEYLGRVWFFRDITPRKDAEEALRDLARTDPLTAIANRRHFLDRANEEFSRARRFGRSLSFVILDIDHFKLVNDRHGHAAGDEVLKTLCAAWKPIVRKTDLLARLGGEEFGLLVVEADLVQACRTAERFRQIPANLRMTRAGIHVTVSAGVASLSSKDVAVEDLVERADRALYRAKANGRDRTEHLE